MTMDFLPISREGYEAAGMGTAAILYILSGDAYVDHPSFGPAIISRLLEAQWLYGGNHCPAGLEEIRKALRFLESPDWRFW